jgi:hypothetical protein
MPLKSKAEVRKWGELVREGKISQSKYREALKATNFANLPERVKKTGSTKVGKVKTTKVIK